MGVSINTQPSLKWKLSQKDVDAGTGSVHINYPSEPFNEMKIVVKTQTSMYQGGSTTYANNTFAKQEIPTNSYAMVVRQGGFTESTSSFTDVVIYLYATYFTCFYRQNGTQKQTYVDIYYR